jgi:hypothetical protein
MASCSKLGIEISHATVAKYMLPATHAIADLAQLPQQRSTRHRRYRDLHVPYATFRLRFVMLILAHDRRKMVRFDVTQHPTAPWLSRQ